MFINGKEVKSIVIRNSNDDDIIYIGKQETINKTGLKIIISYVDGTNTNLLDGLNKENSCKNCDNADGYGNLEGFYCVALGCNIRGEQYNCKEFYSEQS